MYIFLFLQPGSSLLSMHQSRLLRKQVKPRVFIQDVIVFSMGSVGEDYKCPLCGRVGNGGYALDGCNVGPICTGEKVRYNCLDRVLDNVTPNQIVGKALEEILGRELNKRYPCLAVLVAPWVVNCGD